MINNTKPPSPQSTEMYNSIRNQNPKDDGAVKAAKVPDAKDADSIETRNLKKQGIIKCQTCAQRTYQDGSDDPGVSFKTPGHISPEASAAVVSSHEQEHVSNEKSKAQSENRRVVSQNVQLYTAVCPECGKVYVAGGKTTTTTKSNKNETEAKDPARGGKFDLKV